MAERVIPTRVGSANLVGALKAFDWRQYVVYIAFALVFLYFAVTLHGSGFLTSTNLLNILRATATISIMAVAMSFVIGAAPNDLSPRAAAGLAAAPAANAHQPLRVTPPDAAGPCEG